MTDEERTPGVLISKPLNLRVERRYRAVCGVCDVEIVDTTDRAEAIQKAHEHATEHRAALARPLPAQPDVDNQERAARVFDRLRSGEGGEAT